MSSRVLVVNGSADRRRASREILDHAGYAVHEAVSFADAARLARRERPVAVIIESPEDCDRAARFTVRLRRHPATEDIPVLVLDQRRNAPRCEELDAVSYIPEPCSPRSLLNELAYLTKPRRYSTLPIGAKLQPEEGTDTEQTLWSDTDR